MAGVLPQARDAYGLAVPPDASFSPDRVPEGVPLLGLAAAEGQGLPAARHRLDGPQPELGRPARRGLERRRLPPRGPLRRPPRRPPRGPPDVPASLRGPGPHQHARRRPGAHLAHGPIPHGGPLQHAVPLRALRARRSPYRAPGPPDRVAPRQAGPHAPVLLRRRALPLRLQRPAVVLGNGAEARLPGPIGGAGHGRTDLLLQGERRPALPPLHGGLERPARRRADDHRHGPGRLGPLDAQPQLRRPEHAPSPGPRAAARTWPSGRPGPTAPASNAACSPSTPCPAR